MGGFTLRQTTKLGHYERKFTVWKLGWSFVTLHQTQGNCRTVSCHELSTFVTLQQTPQTEKLSNCTYNYTGGKLIKLSSQTQDNERTRNSTVPCDLQTSMRSSERHAECGLHHHLIVNRRDINIVLLAELGTIFGHRNIVGSRRTLRVTSIRPRSFALIVSDPVVIAH